MPALQPASDDLPALRFAPRMLFLSASPDVVDRMPARRIAVAGRGRAAARRRLDRRDHAGADPHPLRRQARPLSLHRLQGRRARARSAPTRSAQGGFAVTVAGKRYGKGSSREHSPAAEKLAGIRLVDRRELRAHLPPERRQHRPLHLDRLRAGRAHRRPARRSPSTSWSPAATRWPRRSCGAAACCASASAHMRDMRAAPRRTGRTPAHAVREDRRPPRAGDRADRGASAPGDGAFVRADWRFIHEYYTGMCAHMLHATFGRPLALHEPGVDRRVRGPHLLRRARARRTCAAAWCRTCAAMCRAQRDFVGRLRPALAPHADRGGGRARRRQQRRRHLARDDGRALRAAGPGRRRHRFAHAAQRRARLRRLRRRHHRHGQRLRHRRRAPDGAAVAAHRARRRAAGRA